MEKIPPPLLKDEVMMEAKPRQGLSLKKILLADVLPLVILFVVVVGITLIGGAIFLKLEGDQADTSFQDFGHGLEYCLMLISTVGYGHIAPVTQSGRLATVFYGIVAIPFFFVLMFKLGAAFADITYFIFSLIGLRPRIVKNTREMVDGSSCPGNFVGMMVGMLILLLYLIFTSFLVRDSLTWSSNPHMTFIDAFYFNFVTLSTAGFGDLYPVLNGLYVAYLVAGLALVFMNIVMVKNFVDQIFFVLQRELGLL